MHGSAEEKDGGSERVEQSAGRGPKEDHQHQAVDVQDEEEKKIPMYQQQHSDRRREKDDDRAEDTNGKGGKKGSSAYGDAHQPATAAS